MKRVCSREGRALRAPTGCEKVRGRTGKGKGKGKVKGKGKGKEKEKPKTNRKSPAKSPGYA